MNKLKNFLSSKSFMVLVTFIGLYMLSSGASWAIFSYLRGNPSISITPEGISGARSKIDESLPKTESCPANGKLFTEPERAIWETHRPIAAVIENHLEARPQSGLSKADLIYEVVAEGGDDFIEMELLKQEYPFNLTRTIEEISGLYKKTWICT